MATCSTPDLFTPVSIGLERRKEEFIGGVYTASNPVNELIKEAHEFFGPERMVSYIMSVGAGRTPILSLGQHPTTLDAKGLEKVVTNADKTAEEIEQRLGMLNVYFRFAVDRGLDAPLSSDESGSIETCTKSYFQSPVFNERIERALRCLSDPGRIQIDRICKRIRLHPVVAYTPAFHPPYFIRYTNRTSTCQIAQSRQISKLSPDCLPFRLSMYLVRRRWVCF